MIHSGTVKRFAAPVVGRLLKNVQKKDAEIALMCKNFATFEH